LLEQCGSKSQEKGGDPPDHNRQAGGRCNKSKEIFEHGCLVTSAGRLPARSQDQSHGSEQNAKNQDGRCHGSVVPNGSNGLFHGFPRRLDVI
jgi:hypothetical protein